jgi:hypothetical protein
VKHTFAMALFLFASGVAIGACSGKPPTAAQVAAEGAYGAALLQCVDQAKTLADSKACRAKVDAQYGVTQTGKDGGL